MRHLTFVVICMLFIFLCTEEVQYASKQTNLEQAMAQLGFIPQSALETIVHTPNPTLERFVIDEERELCFILCSPERLKSPALYLQRLDYQEDWLVRWASVEALGMWIFVKGGRYSPQVVHLIPPMKRQRRLERNQRVRKALDWCIRETIKRSNSAAVDLNVKKESWFGLIK